MIATQTQRVVALHRNWKYSPKEIAEGENLPIKRVQEILDSATMTKLKIFNPELTLYPAGKAFISITTGRFISISKKLALAMELTPGSHVEFAQEEDNPQNWYIISSPTGFKLLSKQDMCGFSSAVTVRALFSSFDREPENMRLAVSTSPVLVDGRKAFPIITAALKTEITA